ncbi:acyl-CoA thioesterase [Caulobacter mirabilis]|uniref:Acyl-CoA thioesterase n=1 Tax=Caulobacter mirabilis TaxID=69666 RepID=A0A2D2AVU1_9CAUL|nr:acyl-CoA thioesterase [Caulobacter mirabilis]ATQ42124.1 acyl-CoA thioesterase [Caulobacter mirabilis]
MNGGPATRLVDIVFPTDVNHHGTLFGGTALSHLDKVAFIAASRHGRAAFVTASCERIDFAAPARQGELVEAEARVIRVGRRSLSVEATLTAEAPLTGERRLCTRGIFHMTALRDPDDPGRELPPLAEAPEDEGGALRMVEMVFPDRTNHYGTLFGGEALAMMGKAAFVAATRHSRKVVVMAASQKVDFVAPVAVGDLVELVPRVTHTGNRSMTVEVAFWAESLLTGARRRSAVGAFVMVAV